MGERGGVTGPSEEELDVEDTLLREELGDLGTWECEELRSGEPRLNNLPGFFGRMACSQRSRLFNGWVVPNRGRRGGKADTELKTAGARVRIRAGCGAQEGFVTAA